MQACRWALARLSADATASRRALLAAQHRGAHGTPPTPTSTATPLPTLQGDGTQPPDGSARQGSPVHEAATPPGFSEVLQGEAQVKTGSAGSSLPPLETFEELVARVEGVPLYGTAAPPPAADAPQHASDIPPPPPPPEPHASETGFFESLLGGGEDDDSPAPEAPAAGDPAGDTAVTPEEKEAVLRQIAVRTDTRAGGVGRTGKKGRGLPDADCARHLVLLHGSSHMRGTYRGAVRVVEALEAAELSGEFLPGPRTAEAVLGILSGVRGTPEGVPRLAQRIYNRFLYRHHIVATPRMFDSLSRIFYKHGDIGLCKKALEEMDREGLSPNPDTLLYVAACLARTGDTDRAWTVFGMAVRQHTDTQAGGDPPAAATHATTQQAEMAFAASVVDAAQTASGVDEVRARLLQRWQPEEGGAAAPPPRKGPAGRRAPHALPVLVAAVSTAKLAALGAYREGLACYAAEVQPQLQAADAVPTQAALGVMRCHAGLGDGEALDAFFAAHVPRDPSPDYFAVYIEAQMGLLPDNAEGGDGGAVDAILRKCSEAHALCVRSGHSGVAVSPHVAMLRLYTALSDPAAAELLYDSLPKMHLQRHFSILQALRACHAKCGTRARANELSNLMKSSWQA